RNYGAAAPAAAALDGLVRGAPQLGDTTVGADFPIGRDDVHSLLRRLQRNSLGGAGDGWRYHRHRPRPRAPRIDTTSKGVGTSTWPSARTYSWPPVGTLTWPRTTIRTSTRPQPGPASGPSSARVADRFSRISRKQCSWESLLS